MEWSRLISTTEEAGNNEEEGNNEEYLYTCCIQESTGINYLLISLYHIDLSPFGLGWRNVRRKARYSRSKFHKTVQLMTQDLQC